MADLIIELNVTCPECSDYFDLLKTQLNDGGELMDQIMDWDTPAEDRVSCEVICKSCKAEFKVKGFYW